MKRVLLANNSADIYGASRSLARLCRCLPERGFEPLVILPERGALADLLRGEGVAFEIFAGLRVITRPVLRTARIVPWVAGFLPAAWRLSRLIRKRGAAVVHTNTGVIVSAGLAARMAGVPHVWHVRDWFQEFGALWRPYSRYILGVSDRVLCVSGAIKSQFPQSAKVEVLHNGYDTERFPAVTEQERAEARARFGFSPGDFVLGVVGRIKFHRKGQEHLLRGAAMLVREGVPARVILSGGPAPGAEDQAGRMKTLAAELGLGGRAVFTGELADPRPAYAAMDVFVLPSAQPEPFGGVVMEAMLLGLPVIGTSIGGTPEQIVDGVTGLLVPPADPEAIAEAARRLWQDEETRRAMGGRGRERVLGEFSIERHADRVAAVYRGLTGAGGYAPRLGDAGHRL